MKNFTNKFYSIAQGLLIANTLFFLGCSNVIAQEWIDITTSSDKLSYQISPRTMATVEFSGDLYILIDGRYLSIQGIPQKKEEVGIREAECNRHSGNLIIKRQNSAEIQVPFSASNPNLSYKIARVVCGTYGSVKKLIEN